MYVPLFENNISRKIIIKNFTISKYLYNNYSHVEKKLIYIKLVCLIDNLIISNPIKVKACKI